MRTCNGCNGTGNRHRLTLCRLCGGTGVLNNEEAPPVERVGEVDLMARILAVCSALTKQPVPPGVIPRGIADAVDWLEGVAKQVNADFDYESECLKRAEETIRALQAAEDRTAEALRLRPAVQAREDEGEREARRDEAERILREHGRLFLGMLTTPNGTNWSANTRAVIEQAIAALKQFDARKGTP